MAHVCHITPAEGDVMRLADWAMLAAEIDQWIAAQAQAAGG